jgi:hypothetical protein
MGLIQTLAPALEPLTTAEVISHLRLDSSNLEPVPDAPTCALAGLGAGNVDNGAHRYRVVFVTADGKTDGGVISGAVTVVDKTVTVDRAHNIPLGGSRVTRARSIAPRPDSTTSSSSSRSTTTWRRRTSTTWRTRRSALAVRS